MSVSYAKVKSVAKKVETKSPALTKKILETMKTISDIVGATLGPGGQPVLIERQEYNMPNMVTKDGVTVFRALGFQDATAHAIMEASRDASVRTANEAGDGTTTATVLSEAIVRFTVDYCKANPGVSPQRIVRRLENVFKNNILPLIKQSSIAIDTTKPEGKELLRNVAKISGNGDEALADAVMECFRIVGDDGNVTITEISGPSSYEVEKIEGYPIAMGYEDSCAKFYPKFINDPGNMLCKMENPIFVLYHGRITEIQSIVFLMEKIGAAWQSNEGFNHNVVLIATGFSESVLGQLALNFSEAHTINVFPLLAPQSILANGQLSFLEDLAAVTGAKVFDPISNPLDKAELDQLGQNVRSFEAGRFRSTVIGNADEILVLERVDQLKKQLEQAASIADAQILQERIGKLTGGIAKLKVIGASNGELREKRDRAEDAVCAVRGAIKHGCLPGGGWMLLRADDSLAVLNDPIVDQILRPALRVPFCRLLLNLGMNDSEIDSVFKKLQDGKSVYDALNDKYVDPVTGGVLDSTPAVLEAIRNSISIAALLGTLGGVVVFKRDEELERREAVETNQFLRDAGALNPADERG